MNNELQQSRPIQVIQFGDGNFIRAYISWMIQQLNHSGHFNGGIASIQSTPKGTGAAKLQSQNGQFHVITQGVDNEQMINSIEKISSIDLAINPYVNFEDYKRVVTSPDVRFVFSNTTEAGIVNLHEPFSNTSACLAYPAKLVQLLLWRYEALGPSAESGVYVLPLELIENNGQVLKSLCNDIIDEWQLGDKFKQWFNQTNYFANTLVDRIVSGYPKEEAHKYEQQIGEKDVLLTVAEPYHLFVVEGLQQLEQQLPLQKAGINVVYDDIENYRNLKVNLLNAPHTLMANLADHFGVKTVYDFTHNVEAMTVLNGAISEIINSLPVPMQQSKAYYQVILDRFKNPYLNHQLQSILLGNFSKLEARIWPNIERYTMKYGYIPPFLSTLLCLSLKQEARLNELPQLVEKWCENKEIVQMMIPYFESTASYIQQNTFLTIVNQLRGEQSEKN